MNRDHLIHWLKGLFSSKINISEERIVFSYLKKKRFFENLENKKILEIGPKHGLDSIFLASLKPKELILIDLPSKAVKVREWLPKVSNLCNTTFIEANLLYMSDDQFKNLGRFDLIFCCGVLYHNVEQLRFIKKLYDLTNRNGRLVIESATTRNKKLINLNIVEIHWPKPYRNIGTITHLPSRYAIKSWLEMVGFSNVKFHNIYSKKLNLYRAVLTGIKNEDSQSYKYYRNPGVNPDYYVGDST